MKRIVTITMDIDESTHKAEVTQVVKENGKVKKEWTLPQGVSTALACIELARQLLSDLNDYCVEQVRAMEAAETEGEENQE